MIAFWWKLFLDRRWQPSHCVLTWWVDRSRERAGERFSGDSSYKGTNPIMRAPPSWPHLTLITCSDHICCSIDMSLSKVHELVNDREAWHAAVHGATRVRHTVCWTELKQFSWKHLVRHLFNICVPQFPHLWNENNNRTHLRELVRS